MYHKFGMFQLSYYWRMFLIILSIYRYWHRLWLWLVAAGDFKLDLCTSIVVADNLRCTALHYCGNTGYIYMYILTSNKEDWWLSGMNFHLPCNVLPVKVWVPKPFVLSVLGEGDSEVSLLSRSVLPRGSWGGGGVVTLHVLVHRLRSTVSHVCHVPLRPTLVPSLPGVIHLQPPMKLLSGKQYTNTL